MITVAGVVFSVTIVALSLASSQYSPRVLRNFMGDKAGQNAPAQSVKLASLRMLRTGQMELTYFTFSYSPIYDESGGGGIFPLGRASGATPSPASIDMSAMKTRSMPSSRAPSTVSNRASSPAA